MTQTTPVSPQKQPLAMKLSTDPSRNSAPSIPLKCIVLGSAGAGKTSLVRRYFRGTFEQHTRVPTLGSDFYSGRVQIMPNDSKDCNISLQVWDTAGRERKAKYTAALSDEFFRHADAAMLVYDATSSTSFTQLLKWHSELLGRMKKLDRQFPMVIVATKMDIIRQRQLASQHPQPEIVPQRDVMGLKDDFKGKDSRYEYRVSKQEPQDGTTSKKASTMHVKEISSTYMATHGGQWTTDSDGSYLDSVLNSEDRSHPDRDMVLLWCMRNGLQHIEASALDGSGVELAVSTMVTLALEHKQEGQEKDHAAVEQALAKVLFQTNKKLDLHQRYAPKDQMCCGFLRLPSWCCKSKF